MNLIRKDIHRLKNELIQQMIEFLSDECIEPGVRIPIGRVVRDFRFNDGKERGQHTDDHGQRLSTKSVEYLLRQADDIFEEEFHVIDGEGKTYWVLTPLKPDKSVEAAGAGQEAAS
jgi:hypothetical protein